MFLTTLTLAVAAIGQGQSSWHEPFPAHKVVGNVYFRESRRLQELRSPKRAGLPPDAGHAAGQGGTKVAVRRHRTAAADRQTCP